MNILSFDDFRENGSQTRMKMTVLMNTEKDCFVEHGKGLFCRTRRCTKTGGVPKPGGVLNPEVYQNPEVY